MDNARIEAARERARRAADRKARREQLAPGEAAFDQPATRAAWTATRRRMRWSLTLWSVVWVALFIGVSRLGELGLSPKAEHNLVGGLGALLFLSYPFLLYARLGSLSCLRRIRGILRDDVWRPVPSVRRNPHIDAGGIALDLDLGTAEERAGRAAKEPHPKANTTGPTHSARSTTLRRRWPEAMERGALYAGDEAHGVLALPDGTGLMEVRRRR
ncbi:hypothetical protein AB0D04_18075 [Streptomyces sp. NPDC048483]|uniref:hypothetical protein n=1 Tax=Streptomyces sp. NPDC048483 TaxID=3154927 RepID=UPI00343E3EA0